MFTWEDFKQFDVAPETLAKYCNQLLLERTIPVRTCPHNHDVVRADAGYTTKFLSWYPYEARMTRPTKITTKEIE